MYICIGGYRAGSTPSERGAVDVARERDRGPIYMYIYIYIYIERERDLYV